LHGEWPPDWSQLPDFFIHVYYNAGTEPTTRIGYVRKKAIEVSSSEPNPQWLDVKSPFNDISDARLGQIMANVQFM
jgi:hypothetical protein